MGIKEGRERKEGQQRKKMKLVQFLESVPTGYVSVQL